ncbi:MAG: hypothetical protein VYD19_06400 [Myxococcota bacterium]|nr:hypothetical protein [Myxococcota bacterium]
MSEERPRRSRRRKKRSEKRPSASPDARTGENASNQSEQIADQPPEQAQPEALLRTAETLIQRAATLLATRAGLPQLRATRLSVDVGVGGGEARTLEDQLKREIQAQLPVSWREGGVYSIERGELVLPPRPDSLFIGYSSVGAPRWLSFARCCLEGGVEGAEGLFRTPPSVIAISAEGGLESGVLATLTAESPVRLLGQVSIGLFPTDYLWDQRRNHAEEGELQLFSVQILWVKKERGLGALRLNLIGWRREEIAEAAAEGPPRSRAEQLRRCLGRLEQRLKRLDQRERTLSAQRPKLAQLLSRLKGDLLRILRPRRDRTRHAEQRHRSMERPTSFATRDALEAGVERVYRDRHEETLVVIGPKRRAHVFNPSGEHITSLRLDPHDLERRKRQRRWVPVDAAERDQLRAAIQGQRGRGGEGKT